MFCYVLYVLIQVSKPLMLSFLLYKTNQCLVEFISWVYDKVSLYYTVLRIIRKKLFSTARIMFAS